MTKILFILKKREGYWGDNYSSDLSSGLLNSASFVNNMLVKNSFNSHLVTVKDNNDIDREVTKYKPNIVIIEAFWVVPEKFEILMKLHPRVKWVIRNHSEIPFLSNEGIAMGWTVKYLAHKNVIVSSNSHRATNNIRDLMRTKFPGLTEKQITEKTPYLPNYYPVNENPIYTDIFDIKKHHIDIGCFGAIRPLKNQLLQSIAAIKFAKLLGKKLKFHINGGRLEGKGEPILKNLVELFENDPNIELVQYPWLPYHKFIEVVRQMDMGLQVSFSETFNIVTADFVNNCIPVVGSDEITWMSDRYQADPTDADDIVNHMILAKGDARSFFFKNLNINGLKKYNDESVHHWSHFLKIYKF